MSCCTIKKETVSSVKELNELKKHFDEVILEEKEKYQLLTLRDKCNKPNYDYVVWLEVKVAYDKTNTCKKSSNEKLNGACKDIIDWVDILKNFEKSDTGKQLSLFGEDDENELEEEPSSPDGEDGNWGKYFRDRDNVRKNNLKKKYSFFMLFNSTSSWWSYNDNDFTKFLPKSNEEMIELIKSAIVRGTSSEKGYERFDDFWWDDKYNYICRDGALSDTELFCRAMSPIRLYLVPYKEYSYVYYDDSYQTFNTKDEDKDKDKTSYRFWFDGRNIYGSNWYDAKYPTYELKDANFILWLREHFNVAFKEEISDEEALKENIKCYIRFLIGHSTYETYNIEKKINTFKNYKQLKASLLSLTPVGNNGSGSGYSLDGYGGHVSVDKKGYIKVTQALNDRIEQNKSIEGLKEDDYGEIVVFELRGDEIFKKAFELFNKKMPRQESLFDFLAA